MENRSHRDLFIKIKQFLKKTPNNTSEDDYKEEPVRDLAKEIRREFMERIKIKPEDLTEVDKKKAAEVIDKSINKPQDKGIGVEKLLYEKRYESVDDIPQITDSDIWKCKADFSEKQQELIRHIVQMESIKLGIPRPKIVFLELDDEEKTLGYYNHDNKVIFINSTTKGNVKHLNLFEVIETATHELRHSYQNYMMDNPKRFPFINGLIKEYFDYEKKIYPDTDRQKTDEGLVEYLNNALEVDARSYAGECVFYYTGKSLQEIEELDSVIDEPIHNQILLGLRDEVPNGRNPLMVVGRDFEAYKQGETQRIQFAISTDKEKYISGKKHRNILNKNSNNEKGMVNSMASEMSGATDLSEGAQQTAAKKYMEVVQNIQYNCENMIRNFEERIKEHPYKQLQHVANTFIDLHNTSVPTAIKEAIQEWTRSDESFSKLLQDLDEDCSQESINAAERLQNHLIEQVDAYFTSISEITVDKPIQVNEEIIRQDQAFINSWLKHLNALKGQWKTRFEAFSDFNSIYANMISMVVTTFTNVESVYEAAQTDVSKVADVYKEKRTGNIANAIRAGENRITNIKDTRDVFAALRAKKK